MEQETPRAEFLVLGGMCRELEERLEAFYKRAAGIPLTPGEVAGPWEGFEEQLAEAKALLTSVSPPWPDVENVMDTMEFFREATGLNPQTCPEEYRLMALALDALRMKERLLRLESHSSYWTSVSDAMLAGEETLHKAAGSFDIGEEVCRRLSGHGLTPVLYVEKTIPHLTHLEKALDVAEDALGRYRAERLASKREVGDAERRVEDISLALKEALIPMRFGVPDTVKDYLRKHL